MADKLVNLPDDWSVVRRYIDMLDGSWAERLAIVMTPASSGGLLIKKVIAAATTNATVVKAAAGQVFGMEFANNAAYPVFVKLFNKVAAPTPGTDTPVWTIQIPAGGRAEINRPAGVAFSLGIGYTITKLVDDTDVTAVALADVVGTINYF